MIPSKSITLTVADLVATDAILAATATDTLPAAFTDGDLAISILNPLPRVITITRSLATGAFTTDPIVLTDNGGKQTSLTPATADGGDTLRTSIILDNIKRIDVPGQATTGGQYSVGFDDFAPPKGHHFTALALVADGFLHVSYGSYEDVLAGDTAPTINSKFEICPDRVVTRTAATNPTTVGLTAYYSEKW
jgi:hypothetical protein